MCDASGIEVFSMDGLGAAEGCKDSYTVPISGVALFNYIDGTIPKCIWSFPNIRVMHFSGNGLEGTIEPILSNVSRLEHLALAHNQLSGTIPYSVRSVPHLDLSYNVLTGDIQRGGPETNDSSVQLRVNRLSGHISNGMKFVSDLRILEGNIFSCGESIPENDDYYNDFICGSQTLDGALYGMTFLCACCFIIVLVYNVFKREVFSNSSCSKVHFRAMRQRYFYEYLKRMEEFFASHYSNLSSIILFGRKLHALWVFIFRIASVIFILGVPIYILKRSEETSGDYTYSTHTKTYRWFWTFAYISGQLPAVLILVAWMVVISLFFFYFVWIFPLKKKYNNEKSLVHSIREKLEVSEDEMDKQAPPLSFATKMKLVASIVFNVATIVVINAVYIYSSDQDLDANSHLAIQFGFAVFNVMYGLIVLPVYASPIEDERGNINFRLWLLKFNNLFVPCLVTFLSSSSCMQGLLVEGDEIISHYSHEVCDFWYYTDIEDRESRVCRQHSMHDVDVVPLVPPYIYHYQCGSVFLTLYIPVYIYMYSFQLLIPFIYMMLLSLMEYEHIPSPIRPMVPAIIWPKYLLKQYKLELTSAASSPVGTHGNNENDKAPSDYAKFLAALEANPSMLFNTKTVITFDILHNLSVLLTFGLCSPFLTVIISTAMILKINMWLILLGRFLNFFVFEENGRSSLNLDDENISQRISHHKMQIPVSTYNMHPALVALSKVCIPLENVFQKSIWPITWTSAAFFAFLCWDISADKVGWRKATWIPCLALSFPIFMWIMTKIVKYWGNSCRGLIVKDDHSSNVELRGLVKNIDS